MIGKRRQSGSVRVNEFRGGFTLAELLVALMVCALLLSAVGTLVYAAGSAKENMDQTGREQAYLRSAMVRVRELIRSSRMVCGGGTGWVALWAGDADGDNVIDADELVYIDSGDFGDCVRIITFEASPAAVVTIAKIASGNMKTQLIANNSPEYLKVVEGCVNVNFDFDTAAPYSRFVSVRFELADYKGADYFSIDAEVMGRGENLLDSSGELLSSDDD